MYSFWKLFLLQKSNWYLSKLVKLEKNLKEENNFIAFRK